MSLSPEALADIVAKAATFEERRSNGFLVSEPEPDENRISRRLTEWCERAAKGDRDLFAEVLALRGLDVSTASAGLGSVRVTDPNRIPAWVHMLQAGLSKAQAAGAEDALRCLDKNEPVPFEDLLAPFVRASIERLVQRAGVDYACLDGAAHAAPERMLLLWLSRVCHATLNLEFSLFGMNRAPADGLRDEFVQRMFRDGMVSFFTEYAVLARAVARLMENWIELMAEFLARLAADLPLLERTFNSSSPLGRVAALRAGLSDPHGGGRTVFALRFSSGLKLVYKPKNIQTESAYAGLLNWINDQGVSQRLRGTNVLTREGYGWVEYIDQKPCLDESELARFYHRSGMLLALFHVLDATDVHYDNLIAAGEHPVIVDAETLITPSLRSQTWDGSFAEAEALRRLEDLSVLKTSMLPNWTYRVGGQGFDLSGLGGVDLQALETLLRQNTPAEARGQANLQTLAGRNAPFPPGMIPDPTPYVERVVAGFQEVYRLLSDRRAILLGPESPLRELCRAPMRLIFRNTKTYFALLNSTLDPRFLREGVDRSIQLESLSRILCISNPRSRHARLVEAEKRALEALDIPAFYMLPTDRTLRSAGKAIAEDYFSEPPYHSVVKKLECLSDRNCEEQVAIIRGSFYAKAANRPSHATAGAPARNGTIDFPEPRSGELLEAAIAIAQELDQKAIRGGDGSRTWIAPVYRPRDDAYRIEPLGYDLWEGVAGAALFLAALESATKSGRFRDQAYETLGPVRQLLSGVRRKTGWQRSREPEIEATLLVYPLIRISRLLDAPAIFDHAREAAHLVNPELLAAASRLDILYGVAGILLGQLALHQAEPDGSTLDRAIACGDHLLSRNDPAVPGRSFALSRLYTASGLTRFREPAQNQPSVPWCRGVAGRGLAALASSPPNPQESDAAIDAAIDAALAEEPANVDSIHSGILGCVEFLLEGGRATSRNELTKAARQRACLAVRRACSQGGYALFEGLPTHAYVPGFLRGTAGIGYELLRLEFPQLPSVLLWN